MTVQPTLFTEIFELWPEELRDVHLARDMGVGRPRARQWLRRNFLPVWYWPRLVDVAEQKFDRVITYRQLVEAAATQRGPAYIAGQAQGAETRRRNREGDERGEAA
jgi:hypothetical protein